MNSNCCCNLHCNHFTSIGRISSHKTIKVFATLSAIAIAVVFLVDNLSLGPSLVSNNDTIIERAKKTTVDTLDKNSPASSPTLPLSSSSLTAATQKNDLHHVFSTPANSTSNDITKDEVNMINDGIPADEFLKLTFPPRLFPKYKHDFPCLHKSSNEMGSGFRYIKVFKTASSTVAHIVKYIARKHGSCQEFSNHAAAHTFPGLKNREPNQPKSFLFTFVREPTKRAVSDFFFSKVTHGKMEVNLKNFRKGCCRPNQTLNGQAGFQLAYISTQERLPEYTFWNISYPTLIQKPLDLLQRVEGVFDSYDFIGVSDRLNESLLTLSFLLDLPLTDIAYISYRQSGSYEEYQKKCVKIVEAKLTADVEDYLQTDEWKAVIGGDKKLHMAANEALDNTIDNVIGRDIFEARLRDYVALTTLVQECNSICSSTCSEDGQYKEQIACLPCMDEKKKQWLIENETR